MPRPPPHRRPASAPPPRRKERALGRRPRPGWSRRRPAAGSNPAAPVPGESAAPRRRKSGSRRRRPPQPGQSSPWLLQPLLRPIDQPVVQRHDQRLAISPKNAVHPSCCHRLPQSHNLTLNLSISISLLHHQSPIPPARRRCRHPALGADEGDQLVAHEEAGVLLWQQARVEKRRAAGRRPAAPRRPPACA
jgi:hypothetical protein